MNIEKIFNWISIVGGVIGGVLADLLGGWDALLIAILVLMVLDYLTGLVKAAYLKKLSSEIGFKGICKKVMMLLVIAFAHILHSALGETIPFREITISFFVVNEGLSILENAAVMIPIPEKLKDTLLQLRDKDAVTAEKEEE